MNRRNFIQASSTLALTTMVKPSWALNSSKDSKLNIGLIGVGLRGTNHLENILLRKDCSIRAICDIDQNRIKIARDLIEKEQSSKVEYFSANELDYQNLLALKNLDAVIISTPWLWHTRMAVDAMEAGVYAGLEVSAANTLEECWDLVNTHERTGTHMMLLENVNFKSALGWFSPPFSTI